VSSPGDLGAAAPRVIVGVVERGDQRGRTLGFPTANVALAHGEQMPAEGIYAARVTLADGSLHRAAVSIGRRPTFYAEGFILVEVHLLDFDRDLYGETIEVTLTQHLRGQLRFANVDELIERMHVDCDEVRACVTL
jgi:riboflavin kinase/FMN adenylyltransferase